MRYPKLIVLITSVVALSAQANQGLDVEVIDVELQPKVEKVQETSVATPSQRVIILNQQPTSASNAQIAQIQQQPVTQVEASPLSLSRAEQLRKARNDAELDTEQKIVEKLEESRLLDEKRRADALFGNKDLSQKQVVVEEQEVVEVEALQPEPTAVDVEAVKADITNTIREELSVQKEEEASRYYMSGQVGQTHYDGVVMDYMESEFTTGFAVGTEMDSGFTVEGSFSYSRFNITNDFSWYYWNFATPFYEQLDQYNTALAVKYSPLKGKVKPAVGALLSYTYREYSQMNQWIHPDRRGDFANVEESDALDMGFIASIDVAISKTFSVGAEYRYVTNIYTFNDEPFSDASYRNRRVADPIEELDYSTVSFVGKFTF